VISQDGVAVFKKQSYEKQQPSGETENGANFPLSRASLIFSFSLG